MTKDAFYFPHFSNARTDSKILKLRRVMGIEGYGIYFMLLEVLRDQSDFRFPLDGIEDISYEWHVSKEKIAAVITNFDLFTIEENKFFSLKFIEYLQPYIKRKERARVAANIRWGSRNLLPENTDDANAMQMDMQMQCDGNASKVNTIKVKDNKNYTYSKFYDYQIEISNAYKDGKPDTTFTEKYQKFIAWLHNDGDFLKRDILGNPVGSKKTNLLSMRDQLTFDEFCQLQDKCNQEKINLAEVFKDMENWVDLKKRKAVYRSALTFIKNRKQK